jgi:hypothetical protein
MSKRIDYGQIAAKLDYPTLDKKLEQLAQREPPKNRKTAIDLAFMVWRNGVRTFVAALRGRTSQSCSLGALAAAPGSVTMRRASPVRLLLNIFSIAP